MSTPESEYPKHYPWCVVGQLNADVAELTEAVAAKDRRIAELEAQIAAHPAALVETCSMQRAILRRHYPIHRNRYERRRMQVFAAVRRRNGKRPMWRLAQ